MLEKTFNYSKLAFLWFGIIPLVTSSITNLADVPCGRQKRDDRNPKIVSSFLSKPSTYHGEFPWMVSIKFKNGDHFCGGFAINKKFILSAAHCFDGILNKFTKLNMMKATVGEHHQLESEEPVDAIDINLNKIIRHPNYNQYNLSHDIALLKLETAMEWSPFVQPLCLPPEPTTSSSDQKTNKNSYGTIVGWGRTSEKNRAPSDILLQASIPILGTKTCQQYFSLAQFKYNMDKEHQFCAGKFFGGVDTCLGDSGGPLMVRQQQQQQQQVQASALSTDQMTALGIVSFGKGCGRVALPGIYTRIASYIPWIKDQISLDA